MPDSEFWDKVAAEREPRTRKGAYTQADLVQALVEIRAVLQLAAERIKAQASGRKDDELLKRMREAYREARAIGRQFEMLPVPPKKQAAKKRE